MAKLFTFLTIFFSLATFDANAQGISGNSIWKNQRGSQMTIASVDATGKFVGQFVNQAAGFECAGQTYDLVGRLTGAKFFFVVTFTKCNTVTRWAGRVVGKQLRTNWNLIYVDPNGAIKKLNGSDVFNRVN